MQRATKRAKSAQACASCKKHKTRCEILDYSSSPVRCHRCTVLSNECSYERTQVPSKPQPAARPVPMTATASREVDPSISGESRIWSFITEGRNIDWSAPMLAIRHLTTLPSLDASQVTFVNNDLSLSMILPESRIDYLIDLFNVQYTPWLNFQPVRNSKNPLVDIACSAVAARHLDGEAGKEVRVRLQTLARDSIAQMIFAPSALDSIEAVQCLIILSLWGPFGAPTDTQGWDARSLISTAVRMALNLRLNHASATANDMRKREVNPIASNIAETSERARLWIALTNAESLLCLGTRCARSSRRSTEDIRFVEFPRVFTARPDLQNLRLGLTARQFDLYEEGTAMCLGSNKEEWAQDMKNVLEQMRREKRLLVPLPVILETDQFYFHALNISYEACRLLALYHAFWEARSSLPQIPLGRPWHAQFMASSGERHIFNWARDMLQTCEALLVSFLSAPPSAAPPVSAHMRMRTAPDTYFNIIALAAAYLVGVKFLVRRVGGPEHNHTLLGASDLILAQTIATLQRAACGPGHAAHRCALLVQSMVGKWNARDSAGLKVPQPQPLPQDSPSAASPADLGLAQPVNGGSAAMDAQPFVFEYSGSQQGFDMEFMFLNSMLADDAALWDMLASATENSATLDC
ncbi:hypothetical protein DFH06DRAFT_286369 [Mycena polygramma]|nr:hypothetical protein DFH06DRAFT_286369 [Mycena polygramma]